ncbi:MAG: ABC transporter permease subunit [Beijerinckiaceae bacterium]
MAYWIELAMAGVVSGLVIGLAALAVTLVFGIARFPNAAAGDMMTVGAYGALYGHKLTGFLVLGGLTGAAAGALIGFLGWTQQDTLALRKKQHRQKITSHCSFKTSDEIACANPVCKFHEPANGFFLLGSKLLDICRSKSVLPKL